MTRLILPKSSFPAFLNLGGKDSGKICNSLPRRVGWCIEEHNKVLMTPNENRSKVGSICGERGWGRTLRRRWNPIKAQMKDLGMLDHFTRVNFVVLRSEEHCPQTAMADLSSVSAFAVEITPWHLCLLPYLITPPYCLHPPLQILLHALYPVHLILKSPCHCYGP